MKSKLTTLSRNLFQIVILGERLLAQACVIISELREIKELLRIQNERGGDGRLLTADEAAKKLKVSLYMMGKLEKEGELKPMHFQSKRYYRETDIE